MSKRGKPYEEVVAEVAQSFDSKASVSQGQWFNGPDGRRDMDVLIEGSNAGTAHRILIECKDYDPRTTGPVGIPIIDALDSKRRDLEVTATVLCSNAGFTADAIRKARRVEIGLVSVLRKDDARVRYAISEEIYIRRISVEAMRITVHGPEVATVTDTTSADILFAGRPVVNWCIRRLHMILAANPIVNGTLTATHSFRQPVELTIQGKPFSITRLDINFTVKGGWFAQQITLDATSGFFDWLRRRVRLAPGPAQLQLIGVDVNAGEAIPRPPNLEALFQKQVVPGEVSLALLDIRGLNPLEPVPPLEDFIVAEDLIPFIENIPEELMTSVDI